MAEVKLISKEEIQALYKSFKKGKHAFIASLAEEMGLNPDYVKNTYFSGFWNIPIEHRPFIKQKLEQKVSSEKASA